MKPLLLSLLLLTIPVASTFSQDEMQDVIYLKNGSVVRGTIVELVSDVSVKIKLQDGIVYIYPMNEVREITKEPALMSLMQKKHDGRYGRKSPELAFVLSLIFPGAGQFYNGDIGKGIAQEAIIAGGIVVVIIESNKNPGASGLDTRNSTIRIAGVTMIAGGVLWSLIDAPTSASKKNKMLSKNRYGHFLEFNSGKHVVGIDLALYGSKLAGKVTFHF